MRWVFPDGEATARTAIRKSGPNAADSGMLSRFTDYKEPPSEFWLHGSRPAVAMTGRGGVEESKFTGTTFRAIPQSNHNSIMIIGA